MPPPPWHLHWARTRPIRVRALNGILGAKYIATHDLHISQWVYQGTQGAVMTVGTKQKPQSSHLPLSPFPLPKHASCPTRWSWCRSYVMSRLHPICPFLGPAAGPAEEPAYRALGFGIVRFTTYCALWFRAFQVRCRTNDCCWPRPLALSNALPVTNKHIVSGVPDVMVMPDTAWHSCACHRT